MTVTTICHNNHHQVFCFLQCGDFFLFSNGQTLITTDPPVHRVEGTNRVSHDHDILSIHGEEGEELLKEIDSS